MDGFKNKLKHSNNQMLAFERRASQGFGNAARSVVGFGAAMLGVVGLGSLGKLALDGASAMEGYRNTLNVVMKDQEKAAQTMAWAVDFANKTPFETDKVVEATVKLQSYGLEAQKVMPAIGDMAGVMNKDIIQAVEAIADAQTGELERLKEFGITKQMIVEQGNKIMRGKEIVSSKGQITDQEAFNKTLFSLMEDRYKGGMDLQSKTWRGLMSTVSGVFKTSLAQMMGVSKTGEIVVGGLFDTVKGKVKTLADTLIKWSQDGTIDRASVRITQGMNAVGDAIGWVKDNSWWLIPVLGGLGASLTALKVINTVNGLMKAWRTATIFQTIATVGLNAALWANPMAWIVIGIGAVVAAGIYLWKNWDTISAKAKALWQDIRYNFKSGVNTVIGYINYMIDKINLIPGIKVGKIAELEVASREVSMGNLRAKESMASYATGINRVPRDMTARIHKDEAVIPAKHNPYNPNAKAIGATGGSIFNINISGYNKSTDEIINEFVPKLKLRLANS